MAAEPAPFEIRRIAEARKSARADRNWAEADRLKAEIEAAGWKVIDRGRSFDLERAHPPDDVVDGVRRYGASASVPSRLAEPAAYPVTVVAVAQEGAPGAGFAAHAPATQVVLVANDPSPPAAARLAALPAAPDASGPLEVVWTNGRFGHAAALNAGLRRAAGEIVIIADPSVDLSAAGLRALVAALDDPAVAVAGGSGLRSQDLRRFEPAPRDADADATAIAGPVLAFRRADVAERGPLDEGFADPHRLDVWWSLVLRDEGPDRPARRARVVDLGLGLGANDPDHDPGGSRAHAAKRNFYRLIKAFGGRRDLGTT